MRALLALLGVLLGTAAALQPTCTSCPNGVPTTPEEAATCETCRCPDNYVYNVDTFSCELCPCGYICNGTAHFDLCAPNQFSLAGSNQCQDCPAGRISSIDRCGCVLDCPECAIYNPGLDQCVCVDTTKLYIATQPADCVDCPCGVACNGTTLSAECEGNTYAVFGSGRCISCPAGTKSDLDHCGCSLDCGPDATEINGVCVCNDRYMQFDQYTLTCQVCPCGNSCNGTAIPTICPADTYGLNGVCITCEPGTTSSAGACACSSVCPADATYVNGTCICAAGRYYYAAQNVCMLCECGHYCDGTSVQRVCPSGRYSSPGSSSCDACPSGTAPTADQCSCASICPAETEWIEGRCVCINRYEFYNATDRVCQPCPCGNSCDGSQVITLCPSGTYAPAASGVCSACPTGQTPTADRCSCTNICPDGLIYEDGICRCPSRLDYYNATLRACTMCPCGVTCNGTSTTVSCPAGQYSPMGASVCAVCPEGTSVTADRCGCDSICPPGLVYQNGTCRCPVTTQYYDAQTQQCLPCPCGRRCDGTSTVTTCPSGTYALAGAGVCQACPAGYMPAQDQCSCTSICPAGTEWVNGQCLCLNRNEYYDSVLRACSPCPCGRECNGSTITVSCAVGEYSPLGVSVCAVCPSGQTPTNDRCGCTNICPAYLVYDNGQCLCPIRTQYNNVTAAACYPCPCGRVCDGSAIITPCPSGQVSPSGASRCEACPVGQSPAADLCGCVDICPPGLVYDNGLCICANRIAYLDPATQTCVACPCGTTCNGTSIAISCPVGQYSPLGVSSCLTCPAGQVATDDRCRCENICPEGTTWSNGTCYCLNRNQYLDSTGVCRICPCGTTCNGSTIVVPCAADQYAPAGSNRCQTCASGYIVAPDRCSCVRNCPPGTTLVGNQCVCQDTTLYFDAQTQSCQVCPCGNSCDGTSVVLRCPEDEAGSSGRCYPCGDGFEPSEDQCQCVHACDCHDATYSETAGRCLCDTNKFYAGGRDCCRICPCGFVCDGTDIVQPCPAGQYAPLGANVCTQCPTGTEPAADRCSCADICPVGTEYVDGECYCINRHEYYDPSTLTCKQCPCGHSCNGSQAIASCPDHQYAPIGSGVCMTCPTGQIPSDDQCSCVSPVVECACGDAQYNNTTLRCECSSHNNYYVEADICCPPCPCGTVCDGSSDTTVCPAGQYSALGTSTCRTCPEGQTVTDDRCGCTSTCPIDSKPMNDTCVCDDETKFYNVQTNTCDACPCGYACNGTSVTEQCPFGQYSSPGSGKCQTCGAGLYVSADFCGCVDECVVGTVPREGVCTCFDETDYFCPTSNCCLPCPCGHDCNGTVILTPCPANYYSPMGEGQCQLCPEGERPTDDKCGCEEEPFECPEGTEYVDGACRCYDRTQYYDETLECCRRCPCGTMCDGSNMTTPCPVGYYSPIGESNCQRCPTGTTPSDDGCCCVAVTRCPSDATEINGTCICNDRTKYYDGYKCAACPCGSSCDGSETVSPCPVGYVSQYGASYCYMCPSGQTPSADRCYCVNSTVCPAGTTLVNGQCRCNDTTKFYNAAARTCDICPCGRYCDGFQTAYRCPAGTYSVYGQGACTQCPTGQVPDADQCACIGVQPICGTGAVYNSTLGVCVCIDTRQYYSTALSSCQTCPCGYQCNGTPTYTACTGNTYAPLGAGFCSTCLNGTASADHCSCTIVDVCGPDAVYSETLRRCVCRDTSKYYNEQSRLCLACPCGNVCDGTSTLLTCESGYSPLGHSGCCSCPEGQVPTADRCGCVVAAEFTCNTPDARYVEGVGCVCTDSARYYSCKSTQCLPCPCGHTCDGSSVTRICPSGYVSDEGASYCRECPTGTSPSLDSCSCIGQIIPEDCGTTDAYYDSLVGRCVCYDRTRRYQAAMPGGAACCVACPCGQACDGSAYTTTCPAGQYATAGSGVCVTCPAGTIPSSDHCACTTGCGLEADLVGTICQCRNRLRMYVAATQACTECPAGHACDGTAVPILCENNSVAALGAGVCTVCPTGQVPNSDRSACTGAISDECGSLATLVGEQCICNNRLNLYLPLSKTCVACPAGQACDGTSVGVPCPSGSVSAEGVAVCSPCANGQIPNPDASLCVANEGVATFAKIAGTVAAVLAGIAAL